MFAYCGNNPIIWVDDSGQKYTPGQIHDFVVSDICNENAHKNGSKAGNKIIYKKGLFRVAFSEYGYCDIYDSMTGEVWEVKRFSLAPSCSFTNASFQLTDM